MSRMPSRATANHPGLVVRDALTGVYAKAALIERLEEEVNRSRRYGEPFSVLLLDLDHFKSVNDAFGHARGDATLNEFVVRIQLTARSSDVLFRYGGDEFVLFLPRTAHEHASVLAERLVDHVSSVPFSGSPPLTLTVSIGVATIPDDGSNAEQLLARADARMYEAKRSGRARAVSIDPVRDAEILLDEGVRLIERLDALDRANRFFDTLPSACSGVLRVVGPVGIGRTRLLRELERLARLRGHQLISISGNRNRYGDPLAALRVALDPLVVIPPELHDPQEIAAHIRRHVPAAITIITLDDPRDVDRATLSVVRALLDAGKSDAAVGLVHSTADQSADPAPVETPLRDTVELRPLSLEGVRAWMRSILRWEPPPEFVLWVHHQSGGLPGTVREILLGLLERQILIRNENKWTLAEGFRELGLAAPYRYGVIRMVTMQPRTVPLVNQDGLRSELSRLLRTTRLITLTGPGGAGKTCLALDIVVDAAQRLRDGAAVVEIDARVDAMELTTRIAHVLGVPVLEGPDPRIPLVRSMRGQELLLILDGYSDGGGGAATIRMLLQALPQLRMLVTSRERLGLEEERVLVVEGLRVPKSVSPEKARSYGAIELFIRHAQLVDPHFVFGDAEAASVIRICQLLDGAPLAISIAGAHHAVLNCRDIAADLELGLESVTAYLPSDGPDQHRFTALMEQAWRLLPNATCAVLRQLSIFPSHFDTAAAVAVAGASVHDLQLLLERNYIVSRGCDRYALQSMVRQFAAQKLQILAKETAELALSYATYYIDLAAALAARIRTAADAEQAAERYALELPHIRRAFSIALTEELTELLRSGVRAFQAFFRARRFDADAEGFFAEAGRWCAQPTGHAVLDHALAQLVVAGHGEVLLRIGRIEEAKSRLAHALSLARSLGASADEEFCRAQLALLEQSPASISAYH